MLESEMKSGNGSAYVDGYRLWVTISSCGLRVMGDGLWTKYGLQRVTGDGYASRESRLLPMAVTDTVYVCKSMCMCKVV